MNITMEQVLAAQAAGTEVRIIINGEEYELETKKED